MQGAGKGEVGYKITGALGGRRNPKKEGADTL